MRPTSTVPKIVSNSRRCGPLTGALLALRVHHLVVDLSLRPLIETGLVQLAHQLLALRGQQSFQITVLHLLRLLRNYRSFCHDHAGLGPVGSS